MTATGVCSFSQEACLQQVEYLGFKSFSTDTQKPVVKIKLTGALLCTYIQTKTVIEKDVSTFYLVLSVSTKYFTIVISKKKILTMFRIL